MLDVSSISAVVAAVGVIVGVVFAYLEIRSLVRTRKTDLVVRLYSTLTNKDFLEAWKESETERLRTLKTIARSMDS